MNPMAQSEKSPETNPRDLRNGHDVKPRHLFYHFNQLSMSVILKTLAYLSPTTMTMWDTKQLQQNPRYMKHLLVGSWESKQML